MNKIIITGRMTKEAELRTTPTDKHVASFTVACDRPFLNKEGKRDTDFIPTVIWGKAADYIAERGYKGCKVLVEGRLQIRNFDAKDGTKHWVTEIMAQSLEILGPKKENVEQDTEPMDNPDTEEPTVTEAE
jgi:single-strand DNA-binding protein